MSHKHAKKIRAQLRAQGEDPRQAGLVRNPGDQRRLHRDSGRKLYQWAKTQ